MAKNKEAEKLQKKLERELAEQYRRAASEMTEKYIKYTKDFARKDANMAAKVASGKLSEADYKAWRRGQMFTTQRMKDMIDTLAMDLTRVDKIAANIISDFMPDMYASGANFAAYRGSQAIDRDISWTIYNRRTVANLARESNRVLPSGPRVKVPEDKRWNERHIKSELMQGILQGESNRAIARRFQNVTDMDLNSALRNARTAATSAMNCGALDRFGEMAEMGINVKKRWIATLDSHTRHTHAALDGETIPLKDEFSNGLMYPADPDGKASEVYNCRCDMVPEFDDYPSEFDERFSRLGDESYEEWKERHEAAIKMGDLI